MNGARKMKAAIFRIISNWMEPHPLAMMAAPAKPPISVCDDEEGMPFHHVNKFHAMAASTPARMMGRVMYSSITVFETVLAMPKPPITYLAMKKATKLNAAAQSTAWKGVSTRVETIVAMELAASWNPLM